MKIDKFYSCPMDYTQHENARDAILCWRNHMPDLFRYYTLAHIARSIGGASRERVRQIANSLDNTKRKQPYHGIRTKRGKEADEHRKALSRRWKQLH